MDPVRSDHRVCADLSTVVEGEDRLVLILSKIDALVSCIQAIGRERVREYAEQICTVDSVHSVPTGGVECDNRRDGRAVLSVVTRPLPDVCTYRLNRAAQTDALEQPKAVRCHHDAGADFSQFRGLLVDLDVNAPVQKGVCSGQATDSPTDHCYSKGVGHVSSPSSFWAEWVR